MTSRNNTTPPQEHGSSPLTDSLDGAYYAECTPPLVLHRTWWMCSEGGALSHLAVKSKSAVWLQAPTTSNNFLACNPHEEAGAAS
jgi:hypothetical protein